MMTIQYKRKSNYEKQINTIVAWRGKEPSRSVFKAHLESFPKLQIAGCEENCNTMVDDFDWHGILVICQIYEIRSWRFRQEIITAKRYIGEE